MQRNKAGIPVNVSVKRNPLTLKAQKENARKAKRQQPNQSDYDRYKEFATMRGVEWGHVVYTMVPTQHKDFRKALKRGMKVVEVWEKQV